MKIGIFDPYLDDLGGGERYMMTIAECISKDHQVEVFWDKREDIDKLIVRFSLDVSGVSFVPNIFSPNIPRAKRLLKTRQYDALIVLSDGSIPISLSNKLFIHIQQPIPFVDIDIRAKLKIGRVNKFFCNSYFTKSYIDKTFHVDSLVVYPPIDIAAKKIKKENIILTVGRFRVRDVVTSDYKKQGVLVDVFKNMVKVGLFGWRFVLAVSVNEGEKELLEEFMERTEGFPIEFLVNKTNAQLWEIYSKAKIYWHASGFGEDLEKHPEFAEHFGISTVEAMGAGVVPVVINAGGQQEIVKDGKNGFLWNSLPQLEKKTLLLIRNEKQREILASNAKKSAKRFSKDRFCREIYGLLES